MGVNPSLVKMSGIETKSIIVGPEKPSKHLEVNHDHPIWVEWVSEIKSCVNSEGTFQNILNYVRQVDKLM